MINQQPPTPQANQKGNQELSMRDRQKQVGNRVDQQGQDVNQPRLAQKQRPNANQQSNGMISNYAKSKGKLKVAAIIGIPTLGAEELIRWLF